MDACIVTTFSTFLLLSGAPSCISHALHQAEAKGWLKHILGAPRAGWHHAADAYAAPPAGWGCGFPEPQPGATNLVTASPPPRWIRVAIVVITGQVAAPRSAPMPSGTDILRHHSAIVKHSWVCAIQPRSVDCCEAVSDRLPPGPAGPVLIDVPGCGSRVFAYGRRNRARDSEGYSWAAPPSPRSLTKHLSSSRNARRPLVVRRPAGAISSGAHEAVRAG